MNFQLGIRQGKAYANQLFLDLSLKFCQVATFITGRYSLLAESSRMTILQWHFLGNNKMKGEAKPIAFPMSGR